MLTSISADIMEKLKILSDAAKFDVACTSSGASRSGNGTDMGSAFASGICHSFTADGRCISLLKILFTNECIYDCKYCINRCTNDVERVTFTPEEVCKLTVEFYRRNYIEGLFFKLRYHRIARAYYAAFIYHAFSFEKQISFQWVYTHQGYTGSLL